MPLLHHTVNKHSSAIIFVHGLGGSRQTFSLKTKKNQVAGQSDRWADALAQDKFIKDNFDLYVYSYHTKIFEFSLVKQLLSLIPGSRNKTDFNAGLFQISQDLRGTIDAQLHKYQSLFFITHSMGGIVVKKMLTLPDMSSIVSKVSLYASLSVPHLGARLASIGKKLIGNPQLRDLSAFGDFVDELTQTFNLISVPSIYQAGINDKVVPPAAAIPAGVDTNDRISTQTNHYSILSANDNNNAYLIVKRRLKRFIDLGRPDSVLLRNTNITFEEEASFRRIVTGILHGIKISPRFDNLKEDEINAIIKPASLKGSVIDVIDNLRLHTKSIDAIPDLTFSYQNHVLRIIG